MPERIRQLISDIKGKVVLYRDQLMTERKKNALLEDQLKELQGQQQKYLEEMEVLKQQVVVLKAEKNAAKSEDVVHSNENGISNEQIDELVKEIEYCISQLKR